MDLLASPMSFGIALDLLFWAACALVVVATTVLVGVLACEMIGYLRDSMRRRRTR